MKKPFKNTYINKLFKKIIIWLVLLAFNFSFIIPPAAVAQGNFLPAPGVMVASTPQFVPAILRGVKIFPENPLRFDFIIDHGDAVLNDETFKEESYKLIKYFLASLTIPEQDLWVNLSPYEKNRIIPDELSQTDMGKDMLAADYILKQLTASLIYPEKDLGKTFWDKIYQKAYELYGTTDIPMDTFHKVWIVPERAVVYELHDRAIVGESRLKVMMEEDYEALARSAESLATAKDKVESGQRRSVVSGQKSKDSVLSVSLLKELIIPEIEKEVNFGKNFAQLRQIYQGLILATWYKRALKNSLLSKVYVNQYKINGVDIADKNIKQEIYEQYLQAFKLGVYNYIKEEYNSQTKELIPRKYFSGGLTLNVDQALTVKPFDSAMLGENSTKFLSQGEIVSVRLNPKSADSAMTSRESNNKKIDVIKKLRKEMEELERLPEFRGVLKKHNFNERLTEAIQQKKSVFYAFFKIGNFKDDYNTRGEKFAGHQLGDIASEWVGKEILKELSRRLKNVDSNIEVILANTGPSFLVGFIGVKPEQEKEAHSILEDLLSVENPFRKHVLTDIRFQFAEVITKDYKNAKLAKHSLLKKMGKWTLNIYGGVSKHYQLDESQETTLIEANLKVAELERQAKESAKYRQMSFDEEALNFARIRLQYLKEHNGTPDEKLAAVKTLMDSVRSISGIKKGSGIAFYKDVDKILADLEEEGFQKELDAEEYKTVEEFQMREKQGLLTYHLFKEYNQFIEQYRQAKIQEEPGILSKIKELKRKIVESEMLYLSPNIEEGRRIFVGLDNFNDTVNAIAKFLPSENLHMVFRLGPTSDEYGVVVKYQKKLIVLRADGLNIGAIFSRFGTKIGTWIVDQQLQILDEVFKDAVGNEDHKSWKEVQEEIRVRLSQRMVDVFSENNLPEFIKEQLKDNNGNLSFPVKYALTTLKREINRTKDENNGTWRDLEQDSQQPNLFRVKKEKRIFLLGKDQYLYELRFKVENGKFQGVLYDENGFEVNKEYLRDKGKGRAPPQYRKDYELPNIDEINFNEEKSGSKRIAVIGPILNIESTIYKQLRVMGLVDVDKYTVEVIASPTIAIAGVVIEEQNLRYFETAKGVDLDVANSAGSWGDREAEAEKEKYKNKQIQARIQDKTFNQGCVIKWIEVEDPHPLERFYILSPEKVKKIGIVSAIFEERDIDRAMVARPQEALIVGEEPYELYFQNYLKTSLMEKVEAPQVKAVKRICAVGMEFGALVKVGGQGDVMLELFKALAEEGKDVSVIMPYFKGSKDMMNKLKQYRIEEVPGFEMKISFSNHREVVVHAKKTMIYGITVYMLDVDNEDLFKEPYPGYVQEFYESIILSQASLELIKQLKMDPQIVHSNDHHAALVPLYMRTKYQDDFAHAGSVFTIHNIGYQGEYPAEWYSEIGLNNVESMIMKNGKLNFMAAVPEVIKKIGDKGNYINTVSNKYAEEIRQTQFEMDQLLKDVTNRFGGIQNGIDLEVWNPKTDKNIKANYSIEDGVVAVKEARQINKRDLQEALAQDTNLKEFLGMDPDKKFDHYGFLTRDSKRPLIGVVSRLVGQKQLDILSQIIKDVVEGKREDLGFDLVILGSGENWLEEELAEFVSKYPKGNIAFVRGYSEKLSRMIYAGADMMIVPSDYEPSGITQLIAMRYGCIPVVRKTGGLADTVFESGKQTGFVFDGVWRVMSVTGPEINEYYKGSFAGDYGKEERIREDLGQKQINTDQLYDKLKQAIEVYNNDSGRWNFIINNAMENDVSWQRTLGYYTNVYQWLNEEINPEEKVGGIDFNTNRLDLDIQGDGIQFSTQDLQDLSSNDINGFVPIIINIMPVSSFNGFLGLSENKKEAVKS